MSFIPLNKFHRQKCNNLRVLEIRSRALEGKLSNPRGRAARAMHGENLRKFTESRARASYPFYAIICSPTMVQYGGLYGARISHTNLKNRNTSVVW
jgi:hypothetical protein